MTSLLNIASPGLRLAAVCLSLLWTAPLCAGTPGGGEADSLAMLSAQADTAGTGGDHAAGNMTLEEALRAVDSLLDLDLIPESILRSIASCSQSIPAPDTAACALASPYPADDVYGIWDTRETHPYPNDLSLADSVVRLVLRGDTGLFVPPVTGPVTSAFGFRSGRHHNGIDVDLQVWDKVYAAFDGVVRIAHVDGGYGRVVVVRHFNGLETLYAHLHRFKVRPGQHVKAGDVVGLGGSSGNSTGSHLHFEVRYKGKPINPKHIISYRDHRLISDSVVLHNGRWSYSAYPEGVEYHTIERGDCLFTIARRYGKTIRELCELNDIRRNSVLRVGRKLRVSL